MKQFAFIIVLLFAPALSAREPKQELPELVVKSADTRRVKDHCAVSEDRVSHIANQRVFHNQYPVVRT